MEAEAEGGSRWCGDGDVDLPEVAPELAPEVGLTAPEEERRRGGGGRGVMADAKPEVRTEASITSSI